MLSVKKTGIIAGIVLFVIVCAFIGYNIWFKPTKILVVNPLPAQEAEIVLNNDSRHIKVVCKTMEEATDFDKYDAVLMYGRGLYLDSLQLASIEKAASKGIPVFTNTLRNFSFVVSHNIDSIQTRTLQNYFSNACSKNYRNLLRYVRSIATPHRIGDRDFEKPVEMPKNLFYHLEAGRYFETAELLEHYLKGKGLYKPDGGKIAFISGVSFPVENNRAHVDTLISRLTQSGYNIYPLTATGKSRANLIKSVKPDAIVYLPMGRLGNDTLINWAYDNKIPLFMPFPLVQPREEWLDINNPLSAGTLNARIVVPEIDGGMTPLCISTQNQSPDGFMLYTPEKERVDAFIEQFSRFMNLKKLPNAEKKVAIGYFKTPGKDALLASGMEVIPSLYNFLKRLASEGYDVSGLPDNLERFKHLVMTEGMVPGDYAHMAQKKILETTHPVWIDKNEYEEWAKKTLLPEKYKEVEERYGKAPGQLMARGDSIAIAGLTFGNVFIFPQPRPALGDDDFKLVHGVEVAPPHSYLAPYLYVAQKFNTDALIHFGTHGNLEFTPGKNAGLSQADWAEVLVGNRPHFYFYTTGNVGEAIIAKRRSHAVIVTHLTPPYVESGMRQKYSDLIERLHQAIANPKFNNLSLKRDIVSNGFDKDLGLESAPDKCYSIEQLKNIDAYVEELSNEKITGAYYVMGVPYSPKDMASSVIAMTADRIAYDKAKKDLEKGIISKDNLQDFTYISHHYVPNAKSEILETLNSGKASSETDCVLETKRLLTESAGAEINAMVSALDGVPVRPAPGGDPVRNPNVLPMGRNMYSINAEATPGKDAWNTGVTLAENTVKNYLSSHGEYPRKVSYTFWAGEFISSEGATVAQALRMLGVEPIWDDQGRVMDLKLTPSEELGRPRINIMVQVSGQLRDIAGSRLKMLTDAVRLAAESDDDKYPNYVAEGSLCQEKELVEKGESPKRARELANMRIFGPVNSGYGSGMLAFTENSGEWDNSQELVDGYLNNMCAMYGDDDNWGEMDKNLLDAAITDTDLIVQPRQSNTWGPISLDHVYEFTGSLSLAATAKNGKSPDAVMADYRNPYLPRMQKTKEAVAVETRATILNPQFITERMKGDATTAQMFGEIFRNIFGWSATRPQELPENIYDELYDIYVEDKNGLGLEEYFDRVNPAALQEMTATMLESARKHYWDADKMQLEKTAELHARITEKHGAPCTEFVCANSKLQKFTAGLLPEADASNYRQTIADATGSNDGARILKEERIPSISNLDVPTIAIYIIGALILTGLVAFAIVSVRKRKVKK